jgi:hypothetical protein
MSRAAPPVKEDPGSRPSKPGRRSKELVRRYRPYRFFASAYSRLLDQRCAYGLLALFQCSGCGAVALDPLGWNGPHRPLYGACADPEARNS